MTFQFAPWALDGARTPASLARIGAYAGSAGKSGIIQPGDLRVVPLAVPGQGIRVISGSATILNRYLTNPDESYIVSNPTTHTVLPGSMPATQASAAYYAVCVVVGDPEYNQAGHPYMPAGTLDPSIAPDYEYVRVVIVPCSPTTTRFEQLNLNYPAYMLARLEIPANTSTITSSMIVDVRKLAQPRQDRELLFNTLVPMQHLTSSTYVDWPSWKPSITIPTWATRAMMTFTMHGVWAYPGSCNGTFRASLGSLVGADAGYDTDSVNYERRSYAAAVGGSVASLAGQTVTAKLQGRRTGSANNGFISTGPDGMVHTIIDIQFYEEPV